MVGGGGHRFDVAERQRILQGEIVTRDFEELSDKELSVALAMTVPLPRFSPLRSCTVGRTTSGPCVGSSAATDRPSRANAKIRR